MGYLLDTNILSALRRPWHLPDDVLNRISAIDPDGAAVSVVVWMELEIGVQSMERRDPTQGRDLRRWLTQARLRYGEQQVLPVDETIALKAAHLQVPNRMETADALIAATALARELTLVTRNVRDFQIPGLSLFNPWDPDGG